jgi:hypothetical protein
MTDSYPEFSAALLDLGPHDLRFDVLDTDGRRVEPFRTNLGTVFAAQHKPAELRLYLDGLTVVTTAAPIQQFGLGLNDAGRFPARTPHLVGEQHHYILRTPRASHTLTRKLIATVRTRNGEELSIVAYGYDRRTNLGSLDFVQPHQTLDFLTLPPTERRTWAFNAFTNETDAIAWNGSVPGIPPENFLTRVLFNAKRGAA